MAETAKQATPTLAPGRFQQAEQVRTVYCATAEAGHTFQQMLHPDYWAHEARKLQPYQLVECRCDDGTFWGLALVLETGRNWAKLHQIMYVPLDTKDVAQTRSAVDEAYRIEYKGAHLKHVVIRNSDNAIVFDGIQRKADAQAKLAEHLKTIA